MEQYAKIGEAAKHVGISVKAIRHYEAIGLLRDVQRTPSGYRMYGHTAVTRLAFIAKARQLGFTLADVARILQAHDRDQPPCPDVNTMIEAKLAHVEDLIERLEQVRSSLRRLQAMAQHMIADTRAAEPCICGIIEQGAADLKMITPVPLTLLG